MPPSSADDEFSSALPLLCSEADLYVLETQNGINLARYISTLAQSWAVAKQLELTPEILCECNRIAMQGIYSTAGKYRDRFVAAGRDVPPKRSEVPDLVEEMCEYANQVSDRPLHAAAYLLWRVNWIHPFYDGNGRIAREVSYLALLVGNGVHEFPGNPTIPELLDRDHRDEYYRYLEVADHEWTIDLQPDVRKLESLISGLLVEQIGSAIELDESP